MVNQEIIRFPYYKGYLQAHINCDNLTAVLKADIADYKTQENEIEIVYKALRNPIGCAPLSELAQSKEKIVIVTSDYTRPLPSKITLPILLEELERTAPFADITILIASGLHRKTTYEEQIVKFGKEIVDKYNFVVHDAYDSEAIEFVKVLPSGAKLEVNRLILECDLLVTEGFIEPHFFAGFSGGRKSILPGVSSAASIAANHSAAMIAQKNSKGGILENNLINSDMIDAARSVNVAFTLNVALNKNKKIIGAFAGDLEESHEAGCAFVSKLSEVDPVIGDIVITSMGGYPLDQSLYQSPKAVMTAGECIRDGGVIIVVASCKEGFGGSHFKKLVTSGTPKEILEYIMSIPAEESIPEQWCAQAFAKILLNHTIIVVTNNMNSEELKQANMLHADCINNAIEIAQCICGSDAKIIAIPDGVSTLIVRR